MVRSKQKFYGFVKILVTLVLAFLLLACGIDSSNSGDNSSSAPESLTNAGDVSDSTASAVPVDVVMKGSVGDGPVVGATVSIYSSNGELLGSIESNAKATYKMKVNARGNDYPLLLKVTGGTDLVTGTAPDFQLLSVAESPSVKSVNINPFSTLMVKMAQFMAGGINAANVGMARAIVLGNYAFGLDPVVIDDPITRQITDSNVAGMVKASEVLGETVRRTRDALVTAGASVSGDAVVAAIAADLSDGVLDGAGESYRRDAVVTGRYRWLSNLLRSDGWELPEQC